MGSQDTKSPRYPKSHLVAASGIAAALSIFLLVIPTTDVEAKKTFVQLELQAPESAIDQASEQELDALVSDTVTLTKPLDIAKQATQTATAAPLLPADAAPAVATGPQWHSLTVNSGDTLSVLFEKAGVGVSTLHEVINSSPEAKRFTRLNVGQVLELQTAESGELLAMRSKLNDLETIRIDHSDEGYSFSKDVIEPEVSERYVQGTIDSSLFLAAQRAGLNHNLTMQMASIFGYDVDFARDIRKGDHFEVLFEELRVGDKTVGSKNILAARFVNRGKTFTAVRYTDQNNFTSYYRADGTSMRKAFIRTPVDFARISSRFNPGRLHPVLNRIRAHKGVDYAASTGTPIKATGDGRVVSAGRKGGYGNAVVIQHGQKYQTLYGHMSRFARGITAGTHVTQGQVIGYVGMTGLATGPHLHYEFRVDGRHVDPLGVKLPVADPIPQRERTAFLGISNKLMASMDQNRTTQIAALEQ
ncbi:Opacity-associated protein A LysM-like domain-containing protein [Halopseudomonas sabulinigri]|uniref:Opacity-associated protein A LysM-like domain-containing protein n=1 Tax=Halopseudomonas sabulinigri TaxID=472181 RepID=A0A1H1VGF6_9GAMM|nr:peptidoglycan DD-metalloendopeptidase family protein [Halopseudomonas sabulinigri]SDS83832.1 Opacity-associated protein A LysM-like domain-containing protein [Halopseudomonas sabulinigri]